MISKPYTGLYVLLLWSDVIKNYIESVFTSGAMGPRCKLCIFMGKTNTSGPMHQQQSMILVPMDTPGVKILRPMRVFGYDDAPRE